MSALARSYLVIFQCRKVGAIGITYRQAFGPVVADSSKEAIELARWLAYNTHEHLSGGEAQLAARDLEGGRQKIPG